MGEAREETQQTPAGMPFPPFSNGVAVCISVGRAVSPLVICSFSVPTCSLPGNNATKAGTDSFNENHEPHPLVSPVLGEPNVHRWKRRGLSGWTVSLGCDASAASSSVLTVWCGCAVLLRC